VDIESSKRTLEGAKPPRHLALDLQVPIKTIITVLTAVNLLSKDT
jgi:hypothetical protein